MYSSLARSQPDLDPRDHFIIAAHHPDRLERPAPRPGVTAAERFQQALAWNVFRTLELVAPAFWLRRLHVRLAGDVITPAPQIVRVGLWRSLPLPPIQRVDGARAAVLADVVIETEHATWTLLVAGSVLPAIGDEDRLAQVADAGAWLAGARTHHVGVVETRTTGTSLGGVLRSRSVRSRESLALRSATPGPARPRGTACGTIEWAELAAILADCEHADLLSPIERALAGHAGRWLESVGITPPEARGRGEQPGPHRS